MEKLHRENPVLALYWPCTGLQWVHTVKSKVEILQNFVAFSEYMNFKTYLVWFGFSLRNYQELEFWHPIIITFKIIALLFFSAKCHFNFSNIIFKFIHSQKKLDFLKICLILAAQTKFNSSHQMELWVKIFILFAQLLQTQQLYNIPSKF